MDDRYRRANLPTPCLLGLKSRRLLQVSELIRQNAHNIAKGQNASMLATSFSELTMRLNVVTSLVCAYFADALETFPFSALSSDEDEGAHIDPMRRFDAGIRSLHRQSVERLFTLAEHIGIHHLDSAMFAEDLGNVKTTLWGTRAPSSGEIEQAVRQLIDQLPI